MPMYKINDEVFIILYQKKKKLYIFYSKSSETSKKLILLRGSKLEEERGKVKIAYIFLSYGLNSITSFLTEKKFYSLFY